MSEQNSPLDQPEAQAYDESLENSHEVSGALKLDSETTANSNSVNIEPDGKAFAKLVEQLICGSVEPASVFEMPFIPTVDAKKQYEDITLDAESTCYDMTHPERGYALVFNQERFSYFLKRKGFLDRTGSSVDERNVTFSLKKLGFRVHCYTDVTANQMKVFCEKMAKRDHSNCDMFLCVILSHGEEGVVYGTDKAVELREITQYFKETICPTLIGKPKLFFIQACRGCQTDQGVFVDVVDAGQQEKDQPDVSVPMEADFLFAYSTVLGYYSWRNATNGSWFIQAFCDTLTECADKEELQKLLIKTCKKVAQNFQSNSPGNEAFDKMKQMPSICSMLTKDVYFPKKIRPIY